MPMEIVSESFALKYEQLEKTFRRLAKEEGSVYLSNPRPHGPVDFIFIAMEPSLGAKSIKDREDRVSRGLKNFLSTIEDFSLHYAIRRFLCGQGEVYHLTDISKGSMPVRQARQDRWKRWDRWHPSLIEEIKLLAKPDAKILAIGKEVEEFLERKEFPSLDAMILHYSATAARHRKTATEGIEKEFERFATAVTLEGVVKVAKEATAEAEIPEGLRRQILGRLGRRGALSLSLKQLMFTYKRAFSGLHVKRPPSAWADRLSQS